MKDFPFIIASITIIVSLYAIIVNLRAARKKGIAEFKERQQRTKNEKN